MKTKNLPAWGSALICTLLVGCSSIPENISPIHTSDLDEVDFVREVMANNPESKGNYEVIPGSTVTTVKVLSPSRPVDEGHLRESMRSIKSAMRSSFHREPNKLQFVFDEVTIEE